MAAATDQKYLKFNNQKTVRFISLLTVRQLINRKRTDYTEMISETSVPNLKYKVLFETKLANQQRRRVGALRRMGLKKR